MIRTPDSLITPRWLLTRLTLAAIFVWTASAAPAQIYRPERARRTITTDHYELVIQKNSQIDLLTGSGEPMLDNAFPSIILEGGEEKPLKIDFKNTQRYSVDSPIGKGNGFHYATAECEWRIATYPANGCLTFDLTFTNNTKKPISVVGLSPLGTGREGKGGVYLALPNAETWVLQAPSESHPFGHVADEAEASPGHLAAWSPSTGRALVAGFLTHRQSLGTVQLNMSTLSENGIYDLFSSVCTFDSPVTIEPGGRLEAETLYLAIGELDPRIALEAFVDASLVVEPFPTRANLHGWMPQSAGETSAAVLLDNLTASQRRMVPTGWTNLNLGAHWSSNPGEAMFDPQRFPNGLSELVTAPGGAEISTVTASIQINTDISNIETDLKELKSNKVTTVELLPAPSTSNHLIPTSHRLKIQQVIAASTNDLPKVVFGRNITPGQVPLMDWALSSRSYYLPTIGNPLLAPWARELAQDTAHFSDEQFITAFTLAAIQGKPLRPANPWTALSPLRQHVLSRLLPAPANSGRPIDLFQEDPPRQWYLPLRTKVGDWTIAALFNWEQGAPVELNTPLTDFGLNNDNLYTVYDFWAGQYLGLIEKTLRVEVPPEGVRLLGLRRYERRPMLVASSRHYTQGASDHTALDWNHKAGILSGTFKGIKDETCTLTVLVPEPWVAKSATSSVEVMAQKQEGTHLTLSLRPSSQGDVTWKVTF